MKPSAIFPPHGTPFAGLRAVLFATALTVSASALVPAQAQMVNDPAETIIFHGTSPFARVHEAKAAAAREAEEAKEASQDGEGGASAKPSEGTAQADAGERGDVEPIPSGLQPQLDLTPSSEAAEGAIEKPKEPLQARAVMVDISSNTLNYDKDRDVYVATGSVHMVISEQNSELYADKMTYDQNQDLVIAEGSVTIIKNGEKTHGSYAKIDLSRKSALINDYLATVSQVRIKAKNAFVNAKYLQFEDGRIILTPAMLKAAATGNGLGKKATNSPPGKNSGKSAPDDFVHDEDITHLGTEMFNGSDPADGPLPVGAGTDADGVKKSRFNLKMKEIDVYRYDSGYDRIVGKWPALYFGKHKIATMPSTEFSFDGPSGTMEYLGPDIGYDPDYGGLFLGPGWDFRAGDHGSIRISPLLSFGGNGRRTRGGAKLKDMGRGPGIGGVIHYRDPNTFVDLGYNTRVGQPVMLAERKILDGGKTRLRASMNEDYIGGFLGYERPGYGVMISDMRNLAEKGKFRLDSYASAGYYKDEFFPNYEEDFFVDAKGDKPGHAGRAQLQLQLRNTEPLLRVGDFLHFGFRGHLALAGYTTGDFIGLVRGGPSMSLQLGNRVRSRLQYYYAATAGDTPFVFDSYYRGRQNLVWNNQVAVNRFLSVGLRSDMNLMRDNARNDLLTGNQVYMVVGPKDMKFKIAYDVIRKRSYFGLSFLPGDNGGRAIDYEKMRIFQPENYDDPVIP